RTAPGKSGNLLVSPPPLPALGDGGVPVSPGRCAMALPKPGERAIFDAARGIEEADARRVYVERACGDDRDLRARVEALLRVYDQESTFRGSPAEEVRGDFADPRREAPGAGIAP